jgi:hypothetical protein
MEERKEEIQFVFSGTVSEIPANVTFGCDEECVGGSASRRAMRETN